jgi:hypothetical protein
MCPFPTFLIFHSFFQTDFGLSRFMRVRLWRSVLSHLPFSNHSCQAYSPTLWFVSSFSFLQPVLASSDLLAFFSLLCFSFFTDPEHAAFLANVLGKNDNSVHPTGQDSMMVTDSNLPQHLQTSLFGGGGGGSEGNEENHVSKPIVPRRLSVEPEDNANASGGDENLPKQPSSPKAPKSPKNKKDAVAQQTQLNQKKALNRRKSSSSNPTVS